MAALGLTGMLEAWKALDEQDPDQTLDRNEWLGLMLDREAAARADKRFANMLRNARMRFNEVATRLTARRDLTEPSGVRCSALCASSSSLRRR